MFPKEFIFSDDTKKLKSAEAVAVFPDCLYEEKTGYGFVTEKNRNEREELQIPELNTGFDVPFWYRGIELTQIKSDSMGCYTESEKTVQEYGAEKGRQIPLCFKADVERDGNYEVKLELYGYGEVLVFAGPRRLVFRKTIGEYGKTDFVKAECSFILNICDIIPRGKVNLAERRSIDLAILGEHVRLASVKYGQVNCPTVYIAGDSTVTDQSAEYPYAPETSYCGWGQMLSAYFKKGIAVSNHAHSGLTTESFRSEGHYAIVKSLIKPGDYLFLQFAHNDQKLDFLKADGGYRERICAYIEEARKQGAYPVIVTPLARNTWKATEGAYNDLLCEYAKECIAIGKEYSVPVVDLHKRSMELILDMGLTAARRYFYPKDYTHTNDYGAYLMAGYVAEEYRKAASFYPKSGYQRLAAFISRDAEMWEAKEETPVAPTAPEQYASIQKQECARNEDVLERPDDLLTRVEALDLVIKAARFFPTNVFNDEFDDVVGHEWYAGTVECACQNGIIPPEMTEDKKFRPEQKVTLEEFLCLIMNGYRCRKPFPPEASCRYDSECSAYCIGAVRAAVSLRAVKDEDSMKGYVTRRRAGEICRALEI